MRKVFLRAVELREKSERRAAGAREPSVGLPAPRRSAAAARYPFIDGDAGLAWPRSVCLRFPARFSAAFSANPRLGS